MAITSGVLDTYDPDLREIGGGGVMPHDNPLETLENTCACTKSRHCFKYRFVIKEISVHVDKYLPRQSRNLTTIKQCATSSRELLFDVILQPFGWCFGDQTPLICLCHHALANVLWAFLSKYCWFGRYSDCCRVQIFGLVQTVFTRYFEGWFASACNGLLLKNSNIIVGAIHHLIRVQTLCCFSQLTNFGMIVATLSK